MAKVKSEEQVLYEALMPAPRRELLRLVRELPGSTNSELARLTGMTSVCWHHLRFLVRAGLLTKDEEDRGNVRYYINKAGVNKVRAFLDGLIGGE